MNETALSALAEQAGILTHWIDYRGEHQRVGEDTLRVLLESLELPCSNAGQIEASRRHLLAEGDERRCRSLVIVDPGAAFANGCGDETASKLRYRICSEDGMVDEGSARRREDGCFEFAAPVAMGYYEIEAGDIRFTVAVAPRRCHGVGDLVGNQRLWGLTAQLYALRRRGDGGIGDFTALGQLAEAAGRRGAAAVAVSPMHALFTNDVSRFSPYSPSSRLFLNPLHADPAATFGAERVAASIAACRLEAVLADLERKPLLDWPAAANARLALLRHLYAQLDTDALLASELKKYVDGAGAALRDHARYEALHAHFTARTGLAHGWQQWPSDYQESGSAAVREFASAHEHEVRFYQFLQWLAERGLQSAQDAAVAAGMKIGIIGDLAVGTDGGGSHAWSRRHDLLQGVSVGAPPDLINAIGQSWGLTTFSPRALRLHGYQPYLEMLRAQLRHVGGLRIDHVIGLNRLWLVPSGAAATQGAYLQYPLDDLFRLTALESWRARSVLVGEDMGTVPEGFREKMAEANLLGIRALWFERDWGLFVEPARWPTTAVAMTTTHDLPTVAGWWQERDIDWRASLNLFGAYTTETAERRARAEDRVKLWSAFQFAQVVDGEIPAANAPATVSRAAALFVARTPSPLALLPLEDVLGEVEQPNIPGTIDEHPNWRRRYPREASDLIQDREVEACLERLRAERGMTEVGQGA